MINSYQRMNVLVTGGAGFIGCNYVRYMLAKYPEVNIVNLDKLTYAGSMDNLKIYKIRRVTILSAIYVTRRW